MQSIKHTVDDLLRTSTVLYHVNNHGYKEKGFRVSLEGVLFKNNIPVLNAITIFDPHVRNTMDDYGAYVQGFLKEDLKKIIPDI